MFTADHHQTATLERPAPSAIRGGTAVRVLPAVSDSVPALRRFARDVVRQWALPGSVDEAVALIVTELAANAVRHSGSSDVTVRLGVDRRGLTVEVRDRGQWRSACAAAAADRPGGWAESCGGRGLSLVRAYASACIVWFERTGTRVVATIPLASAAAGH
ncbi:ATP-binding protein [Kitasatospora sp. NPDC049285]|uniref:ATP-binding protein n=1 Tax=Kitasatospora sp. NPDC049285 TaxID=3157096 RepID=UPI00344A9C46